MIMENTEKMRECINKYNDAQTEAKGYVEKILLERGEFVFDWEDSDAPSLISIMFNDDLADTYITKLWAEKRDDKQDIVVYANLHAYYIGDNLEKISLTYDEPNVDWCDILWWLLETIERGK